MKTKKITIIHFELHTQDFDRFEVDSNGIVISALPCQGWLWGGRKITNLAALKRGGFVRIIGPSGRESELKYAVIRIEQRPAKFAIERGELKKSDTGNTDTRRYLTRAGHWSKYFSNAHVFNSHNAAESKRLFRKNAHLVEL